MASDTVNIVHYTYNPQGIRVGKHAWTETSGTGNNDDIYTDYLIDPSNHTGYAQVLEEAVIDGVSMVKTHYAIGDDVLSQSESDWTWNETTESWDLNTAYDPQYLLYDGHGSTRQLVRPDQSVIDSYSYDGYGVLLQDKANFIPQGGSLTPGYTPQQATNLLYAGEQFDTDAQQYYLRARYYNQSNGTFNRTDPYAGNTQDPQSLHKYAYVHNNPVNAIDPTGLFSLVEISIASLIVGILTTITYVACAFWEKSQYTPQAIGNLIHEAIFTYYRLAGFKCNNWIAKTGDPSPFNRKRPDCRCHMPGPFLGQVYEIKPLHEALIGQAQLTDYISDLGTWYPGIVWYPGTSLLCPRVIPKSQLPFTFLTVYTSLPSPGLIAYQVVPDYREATKYGIGAAALTFMALVLNGLLQAGSGAGAGNILFPKPLPIAA